MPSLPSGAFRRYDETPDEMFYQVPRLVTHIDDAAIGAVTDLYREFFTPGEVILDLMSSWISHLPPEVEYSRVVGVGMNADELAANDRLADWRVQNLNTDPCLPFDPDTFDGCGICVSIDYLTDPIAVLADVNRVLKPGAPLVVTFSNRCFPSKAIAAWHALDDAGRGDLVAYFFAEAGFADIVQLDRSPVRGHDPLYAVVGRAAPNNGTFAPPGLSIEQER